jgi:Ca2+/Na+ antiporter
MLVVLVVLRVGILRSGDRLKWPFGVVLVVIYIVATLASYLVT